RCEFRGFGNGGADRGVAKPGRVGTPRAALHVGKLVPERCDAADVEFRCQRLEEGVVHAGPGTVGKHKTTRRTTGELQDGGDGARVVNPDRYGSSVIHY